jgi:DNA primase
MISRDTIDKIKDYARIEEVVGDFVLLKRAGSIMKGRCPFHDEKTPSFVVSPAKNIFKCFGCGQSGDPVKFVMEHESMNYPEALRYLAQKYRIEIEEDKPDPEEIKADSIKDSLYIAMKFAAQFYQQQLKETEEGQNIGLSYFKQRGFLDHTIEAFQLGYSPEKRDAFVSHALSQGYQRDILEKAGLIRVKDEKPYDFFRARVMFPIHNLTGKVVAFGGRVLGKAENQPKYINTQETDIYTKGQLVYGIFQAKNEIRKQDVCYLVEGYTDVLALHQAGIHNVVASSGTALTHEQVKLIRRFTSNLVLLYDGDAAGIKAAVRGLDIVLEESMNVKIVVLPDNEDPDSFVKNKGTVATLEYIAGHQEDFVFFKSKILLKDAGNDPVLKTNAIRAVVETVALIQDNILMMHYIRECSKLTEMPEELLVKEVNKIKVSKFKQKNRDAEGKPPQDVDFLLEQQIAEQQNVKPVGVPFLHHQERDLIRILFEHGHKSFEDGNSVIDYIVDEVGGVEFKNNIFYRILHAYIERYDEGEEKDTLHDLNTYDDEEIKSALIDILSSPYELSENWFKKHHIIVKQGDDLKEEDVYSAVRRYVFLRLDEHLKNIDLEIKEAESKQEYENADILLTKKIQLQKEKNKLAKELGITIFK